jgi:AmiR/NasT family two-component response regulator
LSDDDVIVAQALADIATIAILQHQTSLNAKMLNDQLSLALNSRIIIEQAKGMISQASDCDMDVAFSRLRAHARNHNLRLTDVSVSVVAGTLTVDTLDAQLRSKSS